MTRYVSSFAARSYEQDAYGHVNHAVYLNYFEQARWNALQEAGVDPEALHARGWSVVVVRIGVEYRAPLRMGDRFDVGTRVAEMSRTRMVFEQEIRRPDGSVTTRARVEAAWVDGTGRAMRVPDEVRGRFQVDVDRPAGS